METEAEAIADLANRANKSAHIIKTDDGRELLIVPRDFQHHDVTSNAVKTKFHTPDHIRQHIALQTVDSLVEYCNRYKCDHTLLFADIDTDTIVAQIDYHDPDDKAAYVAHRATLKLARSIEWQQWSAISGKFMEQLEFARFIEENAADIRAPDGAELLECVRDIQAHRKVNFVKAVRTASNNESFEWSDETEARTRKGGIEIPTKFQLGIPVYFGEPDGELYAFLRWRLDAPNLHLGIQLHRPEHVRQAVFKRIVQEVGEKTECMVVFGKI